MPQSQIRSSLLAGAVGSLFDLHHLAPAGPTSSGPTRSGSTEAGPTSSGLSAAGPLDGPWAYVLGCEDGTWTVADVLPISVLPGWRAPSSSWALVVVVSGHASWTGPGAAPPWAPEAIAGAGGAAGAGIPVGLAVGVARSGETAGRLRGAGVVTDPAPQGGRLLDTLRRNLGLPTPPPPEGTARFLAVAWLAALRGATTIRPASAGRVPTGAASHGAASHGAASHGAASHGAASHGAAPDGCSSDGGSSDGDSSVDGEAGDHQLGWPAVLRLHPAARLLSARGEHLRTADLEGVVELAGSTWTWDVLRRAESRNATIVPLCPSGTAAWMDSGLYARWVLADLPPTGSVWRQVRPVLSPAARRRLQDWLRRDGIDLDEGRVVRTPRSRAGRDDSLRRPVRRSP